MNDDVYENERKTIMYEKRILRKIAALQQTHEDISNIKEEIFNIKQNTSSLPYEYITKYLDLNVDSQTNEENLIKKTIDISDILSTYFFSNQNSIQFLHSSFKEYLLAEFIIESILDNRIHRINFIDPSSETLSFLEDLFKIIYLSRNTEDENNDFIELFLSSFNLTLDRHSIFETILKNSENYFKRSGFFIDKEHDVNILLNKSNSFESKSSELDINFENNFENLWIKYPIHDYNIIVHFYTKMILLSCLSILYNLQNYKDLEINSSKVFFDNIFIPIAITFVPPNLKRLRNLNLSNLPFSNLDLSGLDFSNCNLSKTDLMDSNLSGSNLSHTYLFGTIFSNANLKNSNFQNALIFTDLSSDNNLKTVDFTGSITNNKRLIQRLKTYGIPDKDQPTFVNSPSEIRDTLLKMSYSQKNIDLILSHISSQTNPDSA